MRRKVIGRAADRGGDENTVRHQLFDPHDPVDTDSQLSGLPGLPKQRNFVEGERLVGAAMLVFRGHFERMQDHRLGAGEAVVEPVRPVGIHQKPDAAAVHAVNRNAEMQEAVEGLQHETVATERDDDFGTSGGTQE